MADDEERLKREEERLLRAMQHTSNRKQPNTATFNSKPTVAPSSAKVTAVAPTAAPKAQPKSSAAAPVASSIATGPRSSSASSLQRAPSKVLSDEEIKAREAEMERERERLRSLEKNLVKNSYNALSTDGISETDAVVSDMYRPTSSQQNASKPVSSSPSPAPAPAASKPQPASSSSTPAQNKGSSGAVKPLDDIESLLAQLDVAASSSSTSKPKLVSESEKKQAAAANARSTLVTAKAEVSSLLSASMARDPPSPNTLDDEMATYIRSIVGQVKPVQERGARIATAQFEFDLFAGDVDRLVRTVLTDLHFFLQQADREQLAAHCDDLLQRSIAVIDAAASVASGLPQVAADIASKQNGFVTALQKLIESLTAAAKRQIEMSASMRDAAHNLAECVQETAVYAQQIAEQLKQPLLEIQAFKQSLTSMISAIKKAHQYVDSEATKESIMTHTRRVLEASLKLQSGDAEAATAHVDVLHEVTALLKTLMGLLKK
eukprot:TRINITY_DN2044_c0_g1_i1.p1 TRINITY_DN2044_c0_g1~~TRINITY_DN2044_c0_g1_i1.p1  ORF type:complete len:492 (+),score=124.15 TRINITY_DN2044_c0_g1_i1:30-1505(+)